MDLAHPYANRSALLLTGTVGIGKTTVAEHLGSQLTKAGIPHAVIDLDRLRDAWPAPENDRFNTRLALRNLTAVTANFLDAGIRKIVIAGVVENSTELAQYRNSLPIPLTVCLLRAKLSTVHQRLNQRHADDPEGLTWHLTRSGELDHIFAAAGVEDFLEETTDRPAGEVADNILNRLGWLPTYR